MNMVHEIYAQAEWRRNTLNLRMTQEKRTEQRLKLLVSDKSPFNMSIGQLNEIHEDILSVAHIIYSVDYRRTYSSQYRKIIHLSIPVADTARFGSVKDKIEGVLYWLTGDSWDIDFTERSSYQSQYSSNYQLLNDNKPDFVGLWSGGLDALAGTTILEELYGKDSLLITTGANKKHAGFAKKLHTMHTQSNTQSKLKRLILRSIKTTYGKVPHNSFARTRGLSFMMVGSAVAHIAGVHSLHINENGIGSLNPYCIGPNSDVSRSVHPYLLQQMSEIMSIILDCEFSVHNHFLYHNKSQMLKEAKITPELIARSFSCDSEKRVKTESYDEWHCGYCTSCILRRQSLLSAGYADMNIKQTNRNPHTIFEAVKTSINQIQFMKSELTLWNNSLSVKNLSGCKGSKLLEPDRIKTLIEKHIQEFEDTWPTILRSFPPSIQSRIYNHIQKN